MQHQRPRNEDAEKKALICALSDFECVMNVTLLPESFFDSEAHRCLFRCLVESVRDGKRGEFVDVAMRVGQLPDAVKKYIISECFDIGRYTKADLEDTIPLLKAAHLQRELFYAGTKVIEQTGNGPLSPQEVTAAHEGLAQAVLNAKSGLAKGQGLRPLSHIVSECFTDVCQRIETGKPSGTLSGYRVLDDFTGGFQRGDLVIICGRPGMGKSALAFDVATAVARTGVSVVFSLEMGTTQFGHRHFAREAKVNLLRLRNGEISQEEMDRLVNISGESEELSLWVDVTSGITPVHVRLKSQELMIRKGVQLDLIVVDYLQLARSSTKIENREQEVSSISRDLKCIAKDLNVPVVALCQLNRKVEERPNKKPKLSDLRESGSIEQDADLVIGLFYEHHYDNSKDRNYAEAILLKQRNGPIGTVPLRWIPEWATFQNWEG